MFRLSFVVFTLCSALPFYSCANLPALHVNGIRSTLLCSDGTTLSVRAHHARTNDSNTFYFIDTKARIGNKKNSARAYVFKAPIVLWNKNKQCIAFRHNLSLSTTDITLHTHNALYAINTQITFIPSPVTCTHPRFTLTSKQASFDGKKKRLSLKGGITTSLMI